MPDLRPEISHSVTDDEQFWGTIKKTTLSALYLYNVISFWLQSIKVTAHLHTQHS